MYDASERAAAKLRQRQGPGPEVRNAAKVGRAPTARSFSCRLGLMELLLGCGSKRDKQMGSADWTELTTVDLNPDHRPDIIADLSRTPWPFPDDAFDEVHAYEVLEHLGAQGDYVAFFAQFSEIWRILKPGGMLFAKVPAVDSPWLWGDPSHTRAILPETLVFLSQAEYERQVGVTPMSDFRCTYSADFEPVWLDVADGTFSFVLKALK